MAYVMGYYKEETQGNPERQRTPEGSWCSCHHCSPQLTEKENSAEKSLGNVDFRLQKMNASTDESNSSSVTVCVFHQQ